MITKGNAMASTNKTPNLELSQFIATDKPAWLTDYNSDMSKIDSAVSNNKATIDGLNTLTENHSSNLTKLDSDVLDLQSTSASYKIQIEQNAVAIANLQKQINDEDNNLQQQITTNQNAITTQTTRIDELVSDKNALQQQVTDLQSKDSQLSSNIDYLMKRLDLIPYSNVTVEVVKTAPSDIASLVGTSMPINLYNGTPNAALQAAINSDGTIGKIYGVVSLNDPVNTQNNKVLLKTNVKVKAPGKPYAINTTGLYIGYKSGNSYVDPGYGVIFVDSQGIVYILSLGGDASFQPTQIRWRFDPNVIFFEDFGDTSLETMAFNL